MEFLLAAEAGDAAGGGGYWQLALILAGLGFLGLFTRWRRARRAQPIDSREFRERDENPNRYRDAADRAIVELLETSRELNAQVDTKIRLLNRLVKDAEEQAARLERLLGSAARVEAPEAAGAPVDGQTPAPAPATEPSPPRHFHSDLHERIYRLRNEGRSVAEIAKATNLSTTEVRFAIASLDEP